MPEVIKGKAPSDVDAVKVETYLSPKDPSKRLAMIMYDYQSEERKATFTNIVNKEEMSHEDAVKRAVEFADENGIPFVYEFKSS